MTDTDLIQKPGQPPAADGVSPKTWIGLMEYNFYLNLIPGIVMLSTIAYAILLP